MDDFLVRYNDWANHKQKEHLATHAGKVSQETMILVQEELNALGTLTNTSNKLNATNTATTLRGKISGFLSIAGLKPLALDALYVRPLLPITGKALFVEHAQQNMVEYDSLLLLLDDKVSDELYHSNTGLCFRSIHGTLNHMLIGDIVWYERLQGRDVSRFDRYWKRPDEEMYATKDSEQIDWEDFVSDRKEMAASIRKQAVLWKEFVEGLNETLESSYKKNLGHVLFHVVNHGMHHRGQVYAVLKMLSIDL
ncbi:hypothetical protein BDR26DRAFT_918308 [Obelidium mucronatum]|nr:hypothetical protein BDR26DRAFT_918308 [Obelidium mucronatum]